MRRRTEKRRISEDNIYCPNCGSDLSEQIEYNAYCLDYVCSECESELHRDSYDDDFELSECICPECGEEISIDFLNETICENCGAVLKRSIWKRSVSVIGNIHRCPRCDANLKKQSYYSEDYEEYTCEKCGSVLERNFDNNRLSVVGNIHRCPVCDADLQDQNDYTGEEENYTCTECGSDLIRDDDNGMFIVNNLAHYEYYPLDYYKSNSESKVKCEEHRDQEYIPQKLTKRQIKGKRANALFRNNKKVPVEYGSLSFKGMSLKKVSTILYNSGFRHITSIEIDDVYVDSPYSLFEVERVVINGIDSFKVLDEFSYNSEVIIYYHNKKRIAIPYSSRTLKGKNYLDIHSELTTLGFTEIQDYPIADLKLGWLKKAGSIERVTINGEELFKKNAEYEYDVKICVYYHIRL